MTDHDEALVHLAAIRGLVGKLADQLRELHGELHGPDEPPAAPDDSDDSDDSDPAVVADLRGDVARLRCRNAELRSELDALKREAETDEKAIAELTDENLALHGKLESRDARAVAKAFHEYIRSTGLGRLRPENDRPWAVAPAEWQHALVQVAEQVLYR